MPFGANPGNDRLTIQVSEVCCCVNLFLHFSIKSGSVAPGILINLLFNLRVTEKLMAVIESVFYCRVILFLFLSFLFLDFLKLPAHPFLLLDLLEFSLFSTTKPSNLLNLFFKLGTSTPLFHKCYEEYVTSQTHLTLSIHVDKENVVSCFFLFSLSSRLASEKHSERAIPLVYVRKSHKLYSPPQVLSRPQERDVIDSECLKKRRITYFPEPIMDRKPPIDHIIGAEPES